jgi:hypothetical protein
LFPRYARLIRGTEKNFRFFSILATGGGIVAQEEESREFHSLLYSKQALVTVAAIVLAMIIFAIWE